MNYQSLRRVVAIALIYLLVFTDTLPFISVKEVFGIEGKEATVEPIPTDKDLLMHFQTTKFSLIPPDGENGTPEDANGSSDLPVASFEQELFVYETNAANLIGEDANGHTQLVTDDRQVISVDEDGDLGNGDSTNAHISSNTPNIVFQTAASNLGNDNNFEDIVAVSAEENTIHTISEAQDGSAADGNSQFPKISDSGDRIVFQSDATNLVAEDSNNETDIFVYDKTSDSISRINVSTDGEQANGASAMPAISGDGSYVAFWSNATNLVDSETDGDYHLYIRDLQNNQTSVISPDSISFEVNKIPDDISINSDGSLIGSTAQAGSQTNMQAFVYVKEGEHVQWLSKVATSRETIEFGNADARDIFISPSGDMVVFVSEATNLSPNANGEAQVYIYSSERDQLQLASINQEGDAGNGDSAAPSIFKVDTEEENMYMVLYSSEASNLTEEDNNGYRDLFGSVFGSSHIEDPPPGDGGEESPAWPENASVQLVEAGWNDLTVSWTPIEDDEIIAYSVEVLEGGEFITREYVSQYEGTNTEATIYGLNELTDYTVEVYAIDQMERPLETPITLEASTIIDTSVPTWPEGASAQLVEATANSLEISWDAAEDDIGIGWYTLEVSDENGEYVTFEYISQEEGINTEAIINGLNPMTEYSIEINAWDQMERRAEPPLTLDVSTINDGTVPTWPEDAELVVDNIAAGSLSFSWPEANDDTSVTYLWEIYKDGDFEYRGEIDETSITVEELEPEQTYEMRVAAVDDKRQESDPLVVTETTLADTEAPTWPSDSDLNANALSSESILIEWPAANDNLINSYPDYRLYVNDELEATTNGETSYRVNDLAPNTEYSLKVVAFDESGNESEALIGTETTRGIPQPNSLTWDATETSVSLEWNAPSEEVDAYRIYRDGNLMDEVTSTSFTEADIHPSSNYEYQVRSVKDGIESNSVTVITRTDSILRTVRVSTSVDGEELDDDSNYPAFSANGRYVVFNTYAYVTEDGYGEYVLYRKDLETGEMELVSLDEQGAPFDTLYSDQLANISADGRYITFSGNDDYAYIRDMSEQKTYQLPIPEGHEVTNNAYVSVSDDGRYVAYAIENPNYEELIYVYDRTEDELTVVTETHDGSEMEEDSRHPVISGDGSTVVFYSYADNLTADDHNDYDDIFIYNIAARELNRINTGFNNNSRYATINEDGSVVAFLSNEGAPDVLYTSNEALVYTYDVNEDQLQKIEVPEVSHLFLSNGYIPDISADGNTVAFTAFSNSEALEGPQVYVYDQKSNTAQMVNVSSDKEPADSDDYPNISLRGDGQAIAYSEDATNLVDDDDNYYEDIFVTYFGKDVDTETPEWNELANVTENNIGPAQVTLDWSSMQTEDPLYYYIYEQNLGKVGSVSGNKTTFTVTGLNAETIYNFYVEAGDASGNVSNNGPSIEVETVAKMAEPANFHVSKLYAKGFVLSWEDPPNGTQEEIELYRDGQLLEDITLNKENGVYSVLDDSLDSETTYEYELVVIDESGNVSEKATLSVTTLSEDAGLITNRISLLNGNEISDDTEDADVSADGRYVVFESEGQEILNMLGMENENAEQQIFLLDTVEGSITPISSNSGVVGNDGSYGPSISADGNLIVYHSGASNLTDVSNSDDQVYLYDRSTSTTTIISKNSDGELGDDDSDWARISNDGSTVVFSSQADNLTEDSNRHTQNIFAYRVDTGQMTQITDDEQLDDDDLRDYGTAYNPDVSDDGRYITYVIRFLGYSSSTARAEHIYVHDRETGETERITYEPSGHSWSDPLENDYPSISGDGSIIVFESPEEYTGESHRMVSQIYAYYREEKTIEMLTRTPDGLSYTGEFNDGSHDPKISSDGQYVVFSSEANNLVPGDDNEQEDVFLMDLQSGKITILSKAPDGQLADGDSANPVITADGKTIFYSSEATNLVYGDTNDAEDLFSVTLDDEDPAWSEEAALEIIRTGQTLVSIAWPEAEDDTGVVAYRVLLDGKIIRELPYNTTEFDVTGLDPGETYTIKLQAVDLVGNWSIDGPEVTVTTTTGDESTLITNVRSYSEIDLLWERTIGDSVSGYNVLRGLTEDSMEVVATINDATQTTYTDSELAAETTYYYAIEAEYSTGQRSIVTDTESVTTDEINIDEIDWNPQQTYPHNVGIQGRMVPVEVSGDPELDAELIVHYLEWTDTADQPQPNQMAVSLTEDEASTGMYTGQFELAEGMAEVVKLEVTLADGEGHSTVEEMNVGLPITNTLIVKVNHDKLIDSKIVLWSNSKTAGRTIAVNNQGEFWLTQITPSDDYELRILDNDTNRTLLQESLTLKAGQMHQLEATASVPEFEINLDVVEPGGAPYDDKWVEFYADDVFIDLQRLNEQGNANITILGTLGDAETSELRAVVGADPPFFNKTEKTFTITTGNNDLELEMYQVPEQELTGQVMNITDDQPIENETVRIMDADSNWFTEVTTNNEGEFGPVTLPLGDYYVTGEGDESIVFEGERVTLASDQPANVTVYAEQLQRYDVRIGEIRFRSFGEGWTTIDDVNRDLAWGYGFNVNVSGDLYHVSNRATRYSKYPLTIWAVPGETLEACVSPRELSGECTTITLGDNSDVAVDFELDQQEKAHVIGSAVFTNGNPVVDATIYLKQNGWTKVSTGINNDGSFQIPVDAGSGQYNLYIEARDFDRNSYTTVIPVHLQEGELENVGVIEIDPTSVFSRGGGISFSANESLVTSGDSLTFRAGYGYTDEPIEDAVLLFDIPSGTELDTQRVIHEGQQVDPTVSDGVLEIPLETVRYYYDQHTVRFTVNLNDAYTENTISSEARLRYTIDGEQREEVIGTASATVGNITINAPTEVSTNTFTVYGTAAKNSQVAVYDNSQLIATTRSSEGGFWRTEVTLSDTQSPATHTLQAEVEKGDATYLSDSVDVLLDLDQPQLEEIWIRQDFSNPAEWNGRGFPDSLIESLEAFPEYTKINVENAVPTIPMTGIVGVPFEIKLKFEDPDQKVSNIGAWLSGKNTNDIATFEKQADGMYYGRLETYRGSNWDFGDLFVDYEVEGDIFGAFLPRIDFAWKLDPSGYVYEVVEENRIQGVTATVLHREDPDDTWEVWDAEWWGEVNPQTTDEFGKYGWDVPAGQWQVKYEKEGYETTFSDVLDVPPPHFDVNIPLITTEAPQVEEVTAYAGVGIDIHFDQYVNTSTVSEGNYEMVDATDSGVVSGEMTFVDTVEDPDGDEVTKTIRFIPDENMVLDEEYTITLSNIIQNYADIPMTEDYETTVTVEEKPNEAPVIEAVNQTVYNGHSFDPLADVTATDAEDGDLTSAITVRGTADTSEAGDYQITYQVTDSDGETTTKTIVITVVGNSNDDDDDDSDHDDGTDNGSGDDSDSNDGSNNGDDSDDGSDSGANDEDGNNNNGSNDDSQSGDDEDAGNDDQDGSEGNDVVVTVPEVEDQRATVTENIDQLNSDGQLIIDLTENDSSVIVELTKEKIALLKDRDATIWIKKKDVEIQVPASVLTNGDEAVEFYFQRMEDVDQALSAVYDFTIYQGGDEIAAFDKAVTLTFMVDADRVEDPSSVLVYYWNPETEEWEPFGGLYRNGSVTVTTEHFSTYAVFETMPEDEKHEPTVDEDNELPSTATNSANWIALGILIMIIGAAMLYLSRRRKKA